MASLSDIIEIDMGISPEGSACNTSGEGLPLLNGPTEFGSHHPSPVQYSTQYRKTSRPNDILFCVRGSTTGKMNWSDQSYAIGRGICAIRHKMGPEYKHFIRGLIDFNLPTLLAQATGSTFPNVSKDQICDIEIELLTLPTQQAIAHILGTLDDKIELLRSMNETLEAMARALFKSWFVDFDPVRKKAEGQPTGRPPEIDTLFPDSFEDSELGEIPKGWEIKSLGDFLSIFDSKRIPLSNMERSKRKGHYPYYGATSIMDYVNDYIFDDTYVLMGEDGSVVREDGKPFLQYVWGKIWVNNHAHVLQGKEISNEHLYIFLDQCNITAFVTGAVQAKLNQDNMKKIPFLYANYKVNAKFASILKNWYELLKGNSVELIALTKIRDSLLPKLITGDLELSDQMIKKILEPAK